VAAIAIRAEQAFTVERQTNETWRVVPDNFPADPEAVQELLSTLAGMQVIEFTKDVVNPPDLPGFGLAAPARQYTLKCSPTNSEPAQTNCVITELSFGTVTNQPDKVYVRRADESSVYAISTNDFARLPTQSWLLRDRKFWAFSEDDVSGILIQQHGKTRELVRNGPHKWAFAPGSQGVINDLAVEETVRGIARTSAVRWLACGEINRQSYGLSENAHQLTIKLKNGEALDLLLGSEAPSKNQHAAVTLDGKLWLFEFSWILYRDVASYLSIP
jgi:hypothetical protein